MDTWVTFRIRAVVASTIFAAFGLLAVVLHSFFHRGLGDHSGHHTHEIGQLLGLAPDASATPLGIYRSHMLWLPEPFQPVICRLLHLEIWLGAAMCLPLLLILASVAFDWAILGEPRLEDEEYL